MMSFTFFGKFTRPSGHVIQWRRTFHLGFPLAGLWMMKFPRLFSKSPTPPWIKCIFLESWKLIAPINWLRGIQRGGRCFRGNPITSENGRENDRKRETVIWGTHEELFCQSVFGKSLLVDKFCQCCLMRLLAPPRYFGNMWSVWNRHYCKGQDQDIEK